MREKKEPEPKKVNYQIVSKQLKEPYELLEYVREKHHQDIHEAQIALAWRVRQKEDKDGHMVLGKCIKVSDLQKEFAAFDFIIVLNREVWDSGDFTKAQKCALLDHELCHAAMAEDENGETKYDERGRTCFRCRKHDIEEFDDVVRRHGLYKRDLAQFAETIMEKQRQPLLNQPKGKEASALAIQ